MATITQFEELQIGMDASTLISEIYVITKATKDFDFNSQIRRAAISVMNHIAEGFKRGSTKKFIRFLHIIKALFNEVNSMLYVMEDLDCASDHKYKGWRDFSQNLIPSTYKSINYLDSKFNYAIGNI